MNKLHYTSKNNFIIYNNYQASKKNAVSVIFLHGLMSNKASKKALYLLDICKKNDYNFISFDNFGCGEASGDFIDQTIESWLLGLEIVMKEFIKEGQKAILVGSSMGGWLALLAALKFPEKISALICLAPAVDFTEELIWNNLPNELKTQIKTEGFINIKGQTCEDKYPISYKLIENAKNYLLFTKNNIKLKIPVHLIHGMLDMDISYNISKRLLENISSERVVLKLIKDGDHRLSRESDLQIMANSLEEIIVNLG